MDILNGRKWSPCDALGGFHHALQCLVVSNRAVPTPDCDTVCLYHTVVEVTQYVSRQVVLLQYPKEKKALMGLLDQAGGVSRPGQILRDVGPQEHEAGDPLNSCARKGGQTQL